MRRPLWIIMLPVLAGIGCLFDESTSIVPANPFPANPVVPGRAQANFAPANTEVAARVDSVGRKIVAANKQTGIRPLFRTIGSPQPEIFHIGTSEIDITEGLAAQCKTEGELAAVFCEELAKMVAERETGANPKVRHPDRSPPPDMRIGNDYTGGLSSDQTRLAELGKFEKEQGRPQALPPPPPDPQILARSYLQRAGYPDANLEAVLPLLKAAAANSTFEKQLTPFPEPGRNQ
ncbi:MAG TPA: hypothetical protein VGY77_03790 [Gemmataceae bacterium]|nr:hypothetical protein [Gemmataceae bacterium]